MKITSITTALSAIAAATLVACGGGDEEPMLNEAQAQQLAATTIHAVLLADDVARQVYTDNLGTASVAATPFAADGNAGCALGAGSYVAQDADASQTLSAGDVWAYDFNQCQPTSDASLVLSGQPVITVAAGQNAHAVWAEGAEGQVRLQLAANGLSFGGGRLLSGSWSSEFTRAGASPSRAVHLAAATLTARDAPIRMEGVNMVVAAAGVEQLTGQVSTSILGYGDVSATLKLQESLSPGATTGSLRTTPNAGLVRLEGANFYLYVQYAPDGAVKLRLDQHKDDSIDAEFETQVSVLESWLMAPLLADATDIETKRPETESSVDEPR